MFINNSNNKSFYVYINDQINLYQNKNLKHFGIILDNKLNRKPEIEKLV